MDKIKEMLDNIPETNDLVSAYGSININDLQKAMNRLKKVPTYDELLKENNKQKEILDKIKEYCKKEKVLPLGEQVDYILELLEEIE